MAVIVVAVAVPLFSSYAGFDPTPITGDKLYPRLQNYAAARTPSLGIHHGIDFSQIWLSARHIAAGEEVYYPVDHKIWRRKWSSTYHPLIHWLYVPLGNLPFQTALISHNLLGIAVLLLCGALALRSAGCLGGFPSVAAAILAAMALTPVGLLHLERGQMDLYVASSLLCVFTFFARGGRAWAIAAGFLSTLKVQAWIFVGFYWCWATALSGPRDRRAWWVPATIGLLTLIFASQVVQWIPSFLYVAGNSAVRGPSFTRVLPNAIVYAIPLVSTLLVGLACFLYLRARGQLADLAGRRALRERVSFPFAAALALQTICGTPVTHDYRLVALLGLLPALPLWCARAGGVPGWVRNTVSLGYGVLIPVAFRAQPFTTMSYESAAWVLLAFSLAFLAAALYLAARPATEAAAAPSNPLASAFGSA
ncbi:MAG: hypothetical protein JRH19_26675 [Deltaproteobacteria bacterium]|nr:hypothetical protein [Deltaproteobacteria bacterium]